MKHLTCLFCISLYFLQAPNLRAQNDLPVDNYSFSLNLYHEMVKLGPENNLFLAPQSIKTVLQMTQLASDGATQSEIQEALGQEPLIDYSRQSGVLQAANAIWGPTGFGFDTGFITNLEEQHDFDFKSISFRKPEKARQEINQWVQKQTLEQIKELLPKGSLDPNTALVLSNALYFKDDWAVSFDPEQTQPGKFQLASGAMQQTSFMHLRQKNLGPVLYREERDYQGLLLPYDSKDYAMLVILPKKGKSLIEVEQQVFQPEPLEELLRQLRPTPVKVQFPKFKLQQNHSLPTVLKELGIKVAFTEQADFSKLTRNANNFYLSHVFHAAALEVNESGAEASSATAAVIRSRGVSPKEQLEEFIADRPFCFLIIDKSKNNILFSGRFTNP